MVERHHTEGRIAVLQPPPYEMVQGHTFHAAIQDDPMVGRRRTEGHTVVLQPHSPYEQVRQCRLRLGQSLEGLPTSSCQ